MNSQAAGYNYPAQSAGGSYPYNNSPYSTHQPSPYPAYQQPPQPTFASSSQHTSAYSTAPYTQQIESSSASPATAPKQSLGKQKQPQQQRRQQTAKAAKVSIQHADPPLPQHGSTTSGTATAARRSSPDDLEDQLRNALEQDNQQSAQPADAEPDEEEDDDPNEDGNAVQDGHEPIFNLPPPPEGRFPSYAELEKAMHDWSLEHGYELVRRASKKNAKGVVYKRYYHCSRHGKGSGAQLTAEQRVRPKRKTNRINCPMSLAVVALDPRNPDGEWEIRHRVTHHNHPPIEALALTGHRRRARMGGVEKAVDGLFAIGTPTSQVLQFLQRTFPGGLFTRTDVANMKLKWKKYGTCVNQPNQSKDDRTRRGSACHRCRDKKTRCDAARPRCGECVIVGADCVYDCDPSPAPEQDADADGEEDIDMTGQDVDDAPGVETAPTTSAPAPTETHSRSRRQQTDLTDQRAAASQILQDLQAFQQQHIRPERRLDLNSSSVEILAQSSCGNGDSYKTVPMLTATADWPPFCDAFLEAAMKENTYDTLLGRKTEPAAPRPRQDGAEVDIEDWNEYVKQRAIFARRNTAVRGALWGCLAPSWRTRIQGFERAAEAWTALQDMCRPQGCQRAFQLFGELCSVTLEGCGGDVQVYAGRLEVVWKEFSRLKLSIPVTHDVLARETGGRGRAIGSGQNGVATGAEVLGEEALCFLFMRGLGERYKVWVETLCQTCNIGGFGTGFRIGWTELTKRVIEWEELRRRNAMVVS